MPIGTTIDGLNAVTSLTANDEVPVWDAEATGEPTKKITASNLAASVKSLASLPNTTEMNTAISQSTAISTITFTPASGVSSNLFVRKSGNVVSINGYLTATYAFPASEYQLGTIPAGSRPGAPVRTTAAVGEAAYVFRSSAYLSVNGNGNIYITAQSGNTYKVCYFNITYIAEA